MKTCSILEYGALSNGTCCTTQIQAAINACWLAGGGTVEVPEGSFLTGGLRLRSHVTLLLRSGARLIGSRNPEDYTAVRNDQLEPLPESYYSNGTWRPGMTFEEYEWLRRPLSRWNNGLIRALNAEDIRIIGEKDSIIDGNDCFDALGEENYRGPHAISMHFCHNVICEGYVVKNSANWAHALFDCSDVHIENVTVIAGHDGVHTTTCDLVSIRGCNFFTGDDCVAGIDNRYMEISGCEMNTACSAFRLGGTHIRIHDCNIYGPAKYLFRGSLTPEEKKTGKPSPSGNHHRYNMLSAFTYYADYSRKIREQPGDIEMMNCHVENVDRFLHYNFSGNETWQRNRPLKDMVFRNIRAKGIRMPLTAYGDRSVPFSCLMENCYFELQEEGVSFLNLCNYEEVVLSGVEVIGLKNAPLVKRWSAEGTITFDNLKYEETSCPAIIDADEVFTCQPI